MTTKASRQRKTSSTRKKALAAILLFAGLGVTALVLSSQSRDGYVLPATPRVPRPKTLHPALFTAKTAKAYQVAWEHPELLERMPCYCGCYVDNGHRNNLDCFVDKHAAS